MAAHTRLASWLAWCGTIGCCLFLACSQVVGIEDVILDNEIVSSSSSSGATSSGGASSSSGDQGGGGKGNTGGGGSSSSGSSSSGNGAGGSGIGGAGGGGPTCDPPNTWCGAECVDLTDNSQHCGSCNTDCQGGSCASSICQPYKLADAVNPFAVAVDATHVYFAASDPALKKVPINGGSATILTEESALAIAVDATHLYWVAASTVNRITLNGNDQLKVADASNANRIALSGQYVFFTEGSNGDVGAVQKVALSGGAVDELHFAATGHPFGVALNATDVYFTHKSDGEIVKVSTSGGSATVLATGQVSPRALALDSNSVYWTTATTIRKVALNGGGTPMTLASGQQKPTDLAVDATHAYWTDQLAGTVMSVSLAGGTPTAIATGQPSPYAIAIDDKSVYWSNLSMFGAIMKVAKP